MSDDIITLDVGGTIFKTTKTTLKGSSYFRSLFEHSWTMKPGEPYFIDRSGVLFEHVLCYLRDINYKYPGIYEDELIYYQVTYDNSNFIYNFMVSDKGRHEIMDRIMLDFMIISMDNKRNMGFCAIPGCRHAKFKDKSVCEDHLDEN